ncbi:hypothetical protein AVEN_260180-1 [Araneus ventricosus]|uniref:Uncharacterized protein n=1 Tax=Araneus ventricosus TaxID=182803 RepID=A0A4Y2DPU5_ARAVE|nr:hypothetical protein AVEN_260180-1 [Araneus ventricosus]
MTRTTPELTPTSSNFHTTQAERRLTHVTDNMHQARKHGGSSVESGSEYGSLRLLAETLPLGHRGHHPARKNYKDTAIPVIFNNGYY